MGYINGQVQPEGKYLHTQQEILLRACTSTLAFAFPEAPTPIPSLVYPAGPAHLPAESSLTADVGPATDVEDLPDPAGTASIILDSEPATETLGLTQPPEPDDAQQLPPQIHIQQHLKLHFHNQGEFCRGQTDDASIHIWIFPYKTSKLTNLSYQNPSNGTQKLSLTHLIILIEIAFFLS